MSYLDFWTGTAVERKDSLDFFLGRIHEERFPELDNKTFNKLFLEAFLRNLVQNELIEIMAYILDEEN
mgnify:FL=1